MKNIIIKVEPEIHQRFFDALKKINQQDGTKIKGSDVVREAISKTIKKGEKI